MNQKQNKRWWLMALSVLSAFLVWLGVVNVADPVMTDTVEVPIEIVNDEVLTANGLTYEIVGRRTTTISYEVNTTNASRIRPTDFRAYADMTELWDVTGAIPVTIEVLNNADLLTSNPVSKTATIKIETEPLQRKRFDIGFTTIGTAEEGYEPGSVTLSPGSLYVEGPESLVGQISSVGIEIRLENASSDFEDSAPVLYYDANGNEIELDERIKSDCETVSYRQTILRAKEVALDFQTSGEVAPGYRFTGVECSVRSVPVVGLRSVLASLSTIVIPGESLNLDGARADVVRTIDLNSFLPEGVSLAETVSGEIVVTLTVERLEERVYPVTVDDSCYIGTSEEYTYRVSPETVQFRIRGLSDDLDSLNLSAADIRLDFSGLTAGTHTLTAEITLAPVYELINTSQSTVEVRPLREPESETSSAEETQEIQESSEVPETSAGEAQETEKTEETVSEAVIIPAGNPGDSGAGEAAESGEGETESPQG